MSNVRRKAATDRQIDRLIESNEGADAKTIVGLLHVRNIGASMRRVYERKRALGQGRKVVEAPRVAQAAREVEVDSEIAAARKFGEAVKTGMAMLGWSRVEAVMDDATGRCSLRYVPREQKVEV